MHYLCIRKSEGRLHLSIASKLDSAFGLHYLCTKDKKEKLNHQNDKTMKKILTMVMMMTIAISAAAMPYNTARNEALFLSDKMAYELGLIATQYEAVYEINLDYLLNLDSRADVFGLWWDIRNRDLRYVLSTWQYDLYMASEWFYRPVIWTNTGATFSIYSRYGVGRMFFDRPAVFVTFKGGHSHRTSSFYAGHHFDSPNPRMGQGSHNNNHNNGNHNNNGNHHNNNNGNVNWSNNGNRPMTGSGNPSMGGGFGNSHRSGSANTPSRTASRASGNMAGSGSTSRGNFGGGR